MPQAAPDRAEPVGRDEADPVSRARSLDRRDAAETVRRAVERQDVILAFQPVVAAANPRRVAFHEGLIRVLDEAARIIPARDFIAEIEETETGRRIDCLSLEMGLISLAEDPSLRLSINMSARSIGYQPWTDLLRQGVATPHVGERLILEITERSAMSMPEITGVFMREFQARGVSFALDDFGAGATSFRHLRAFLFDIVKIDAEFIRGVGRNVDNQVLVAAMVSVARHFDMLTVAEAVETADEAAFCAGAGIDCMQGYHVAAPSVIPPWRAETRRKSA